MKKTLQNQEADRTTTTNFQINFHHLRLFIFLNQ